MVTEQIRLHTTECVCLAPAYVMLRIFYAALRAATSVGNLIQQQLLFLIVYPIMFKVLYL